MYQNSGDSINTNRINRRNRPAKNFLAVLGRASNRLNIRNRKNFVARALTKMRRADDILHRLHFPKKRS